MALNYETCKVLLDRHPEWHSEFVRFVTAKLKVENPLSDTYLSGGGKYKKLMQRLDKVDIHDGIDPTTNPKLMKLALKRNSKLERYKATKAAYVDLFKNHGTHLTQAIENAFGIEANYDEAEVFKLSNSDKKDIENIMDHRIVQAYIEQMEHGRVKEYPELYTLPPFKSRNLANRFAEYD